MIKNISALYRKIIIYLNQNLKIYDLSGSQIGMVKIIYKSDGISSYKLSEILELDKSTTAKTIQKLKNDGYIYREDNKNDNRSFFIYPTEKLKEVIPNILEIEEKCINIVTKDMSEIEKNIFFELTRKATENIIEYNRNS